jgi:excisionase family DNA binding protein
MNRTAPHREFLSIEEFGQRIGVSRRTAYDMAARGEAPVIRLRNQLRVPARALETWLSDREREALAVVGRRAADP